MLSYGGNSKLMKTIPTYTELPEELRDRLEKHRKAKGQTLKEAITRLLDKGLLAEESAA